MFPTIVGLEKNTSLKRLKSITKTSLFSKACAVAGKGIFL